MKSKILKQFGGGNVTQAAAFLGLSRQRVDAWPERMNIRQVDGVIAKLVRKNVPVPAWLLK